MSNESEKERVCNGRSKVGKKVLMLWMKLAGKGYLREEWKYFVTDGGWDVTNE